MNVVVLGSKGMLGTDLEAACRQAGMTTQGLDRPMFEITDPDSLSGLLAPGSVVVNCAAYTRVDDAESHRDIAMAVNGLGAGLVARACYESDCRLLQISTDYVFNGRADRPYREDDAPDPLSVYGESKLDGERRVVERMDDYLIVRVQSLFGIHGRHFVDAIRRKLLAGERELRVVSDQICSPTYTRHLATALLDLVQSAHTGIVHLTASGHCSWHQFAVAIAQRVAPQAVVRPVSTEEYPTPARRPAYSRLDTTRFQQWTGSPLPTWQQGLDEYLQELES